MGAFGSINKKKATIQQQKSISYSILMKQLLHS